MREGALAKVIKRKNNEFKKARIQRKIHQIMWYKLFSHIWVKPQN